MLTPQSGVALWPPRLGLVPCLALLGVLACAGDRGSSLQVYLVTSPAVTASEVLVRVGDGSGQRMLTGSDFTATNGETPHSAEFGVATGGELTLDVVFVDAGPDTVGVGSLRIPLEGNMRYGVIVQVGTVSPTGVCIGCRGVVAFPLRGSLAGGADSLYIAWGGAPPGSIT